jgi:hypothetical protein
MVTIELTRDDLVVHVQGWDKVRAMRSTVTVPLAHVTGVRAHPEEAYFDDAIVESWRGIGTYVPGKVAAGTLFLADGRSFFDVHDPRRAIAIDLVGEQLLHLVVEVDGETPQAVAERIESAIRERLRAALD